MTRTTHPEQRRPSAAGILFVMLLGACVLCGSAAAVARAVFGY